MTPAKQKAIDIAQTYYNVWAFNNTFMNFNDAMTKKTKAFKMSVRSAGIAVDEILDIIKYHGTDIGKHSLHFWQQVKTELQNL